MRAEGRFAVLPQDAEVYIGDESLLERLLRDFNEGDILRIQVDRIARNIEPPLLQIRGE